MAPKIAISSDLALDSYHELMDHQKSFLKRMLRTIISKDSESYAGAYIYLFINN